MKLLRITGSIAVPRKISHLLITFLLFNQVSLVLADDQPVRSYGPIKYKGRGHASPALKRATKPVVRPVLNINSSNDVEVHDESEAVAVKPIIEETHLDAFSSVSTVVTDNQLRDQAVRDFPSALRRTPGVQITRFNPTGSFGGNQGGGVFIRGIGTSRPGSELKTYLNGVPLYSGVWGTPLLDLLPVNGLKSITVYKSPQPQINGNNFASINVETNRATEEGIHGSGRVSGGYFNTVVEQAEVSGKQDDLDFSMAHAYVTSGGQRQNSNSDLQNVTGRIGWTLNDEWAVGSNFLYANSSAKDPGDKRLPVANVAPMYTTEVGMLSVDVSHKHGDWAGNFMVYVNKGSSGWYNHVNNLSADTRVTNTVSGFLSTGFRWKEQLSPWTGGDLIVGLDSDWITGDVTDIGISSGQFDAPTFRVTDPYASVSHRFDVSENWHLVPAAGVRVYNHSQFGTDAAPHAGLSLVSDKYTLFVNASRGVNYPGLEVAVLSSFMPNLGNSWKRLAAEQMDHIEAGVKLTLLTSTQINASVFNDKVKNRYVFGLPLSAAGAQFSNVGSYNMSGAEIAINQGIIEGISVFGGLTLLNPSNNRLPYAPKRAATAGTNIFVDDFRVTIDGQYQSSFYAFNRDRIAGGLNTEKMGSFAILNARVGYSIPLLGKKGEVFVSVENIFDRNYQYVPGYPMPGRWGLIGVSASF
jgi:iron complex outermembrane receptor protein